MVSRSRYGANLSIRRLISSFTADAGAGLCGVEWARWFTGGKLNIAWNCLDRHTNGTARDRLAVIWEGADGSIRTFTFGELRRETDRLAHRPRALALSAGDPVAL